MAGAEPGSFRDPASHVVLAGDSVYRVLDERGLVDWRALQASTLHAQAVADGRLVASAEADETPDGAAGALRHPRLPVITYPFEWTFSMLRDAALLQLGLTEEALAEGLILKDATPYNFQIVGGRPRFIDIGSFERYRSGEPWMGYRQFCRQFLFPLMLRAWVGVPFQPWLRGDPEGPSAAHMRSLLPMRRRLVPGALLHVELGARAEARLSGRAVRGDMVRAGFSAELIKANLRRLRSLVESLAWDRDEGTWSGYRACDHVGRDRGAKAEFLAEVVGRRRPGLVVDLGANDGHFAMVAADAGATVVAVDGDEAVLDDLYRRLPPGSTIVPVLTDLANPSPSQGWAGRERPGLFQRVRPDLVVVYGLIHHLVYTSSVPPPLVVDWLAGFGCPVVVEHVAPEDPMVSTLAANKRPEELHPHRDEAAFRHLVGERFDIAGERALEGGTRTVFELAPR